VILYSEHYLQVGRKEDELGHGLSLIL